MASSNGERLAILGIAIGCLLPALPMLWKAASWRGDAFRKWSERVDLAHAGLNERATSELFALQGEIGDALGGATGFTPAEVWTDPDPLVARANRCAAFLRARDRLRGRLSRHLRLGTVLIPTLVAYILGWVAATLYFTEVLHEFWAKVAGLVLGGAALAVATGIFALYAYFEAKLTAAEEMAAGERT